MAKRRYQDYLNELAAGKCYGIFIDDSGSPGLQQTPANLHPDRKSWVGVIVDPDLMPEVLEQFPEALQELHSISGATEFHFADILAGRKSFKNVDLQVRLGIFEFMAHIFSVYRFPVIVQTFDPVTLANIRVRGFGQNPTRLPPFDFTKAEDTALFVLLIRLKWFMEETATHPNVKARVFVDEAYKKNGIALQIPAFETVFQVVLSALRVPRKFTRYNLPTSLRLL